MPDFVTIGETMALLASPNVGRLRDASSLRLSAAGSESNVAIGMARLGWSSAWIGRVGDDEFGEMIISMLRREGIDIRGVTVDHDSQTAVMIKEQRTSQVSRVSYYRDGYVGSRLDSGDVLEVLFENARMLHVTGITLGLSLTSRQAVYTAVDVAKRNGCVISFDLNYRSALWSYDDARVEFIRMVQLADIVFASPDELMILKPESSALEIARELANQRERQVVMHSGSSGAKCLVNGDVYEQPAFPVVAVDSVGAGDAFVAGYLDGVLSSYDVPSRLRQGCAAGAFAVSVNGDWEGAPNRDDLLLLIQEPGTTLR